MYKHRNSTVLILWPSASATYHHLNASSLALLYSIEENEHMYELKAVFKHVSRQHAYILLRIYLPCCFSFDCFRFLSVNLVEKEKREGRNCEGSEKERRKGRSKREGWKERRDCESIWNHRSFTVKTFMNNNTDRFSRSLVILGGSAVKKVWLKSKLTIVAIYFMY